MNYTKFINYIISPQFSSYEFSKSQAKIKIYGKNFVINNKDKCFILYKDIIFPLQEYFSIKYIDNTFEQKGDNLEISLIELENIPNKSFMFDGCTNLKKFSLFKNDYNFLNKNNNSNYNKDIDNKDENKNNIINQIDQIDFIAEYNIYLSNANSLSNIKKYSDLRNSKND